LFGNTVIARPPEEVRKLVSTRRWKRKHLDALRHSFGDQVLFDALFSAFTQQPPLSCGEQESPGDYLLELKPRAAQDLQSLIQASLGGWNLSIEELPFYFRDTYGIEPVRKALDALDQEPDLTAEEREALRTYRWWLRIRPEAEPGASNGGPAEPLGNSTTGGGPPSAS
jgi:hypothetical protein